MGLAIVRFGLGLGKALLLLLEGAFWGLLLVRKGGWLLVDLGQSAWRLRSGGQTCPAGHKLGRARCRCTACGFVYESAPPYVCKSAECGAATVFVTCGCGLSVRSWTRLGRPL